MTIAFAGFADDVTKTEWSLMNNLGNLGKENMVPVATAGDRTISVPVGKVMAAGILTQVTVAENLSAAANSSGSTRYDLAVVRMTWGATNTSVLAVKQGTPGGEAPTLQQDPGVLFEYPLARLTVANGQGAFAGSDVVHTPSARNSQQGVQTTLQGPNSNTSFFFPSSSCSAAFVAPPSGAVDVSVGADMENSNGGSGTVVAAEIIVGTSQGGTVFSAASETYGATWRGDAGVAGRISSGPQLVTGLEKGRLYTAWLKVKVGSGSGTWRHRTIHVRPVI